MDQLDRIASDVKHLKKWASSHDERHGDEADMLSLVLKNMDTHANNHHGRTSEIKRGASITAILALLAALAETIRQVFF